jgi:hypothetical protein
MLKDTLARDSDEEYTWTGTETRPKEIVAVPVERTGITIRRKRRGVRREESR